MLCSPPLCQLLQVTAKVLVVEEIIWKAFKGIVAVCHVKAGTECDDAPEAVVLIVTKVLGKDATTRDSKRDSLSTPKQSACMHAHGYHCIEYGILRVHTVLGIYACTI